MLTIRLSHTIVCRNPHEYHDKRQHTKQYYQNLVHIPVTLYQKLAGRVTISIRIHTLVFHISHQRIHNLVASLSTNNLDIGIISGPQELPPNQTFVPY